MKNFVERMKNDDGFAKKIYMSITFVLLAVSLALIMMMLFPQDSSPDEELPSEPQADVQSSDAAQAELSLSFSDEEASQLLCLVLRSKLKVDDAEVHFAAPDRVTISGEVTKQELKETLGKDFSLVRLALWFAPEKITLEAEGSAVYDETLKIVVDKVSAAGISLPGTKWLPGDFSEKLGDALLSALPEGVTVTGVDVGEGEIIVRFLVGAA